MTPARSGRRRLAVSNVVRRKPCSASHSKEGPSRVNTRLAARVLVVRTTSDQGLTPTLTDPATVARVAALLREPRRKGAARRESAA